MALKRLAEIYRQEQRTGGGIASAVGKRLKEKFDPRQALDQRGLLTSMFPSLRAYKATPEMKSPTAASSALVEAELGSVSASLDDINVKMRVVAKNTMGMPMMSRDINLIKLNIFKMVKLLGGVANTSKTDMFWKSSKERENQLESQLKAAKGRATQVSGTSPTRDGGVEQKASFMSRLGLGLKGFGKGLIEVISSINPAFVKGMLFLGAGIAGFLGSFVGITGILGKVYEFLGVDEGSKNFLQSVADGLKSFNEIDGTNLLTVSSGIAALGGALAILGAGKVISAITNLGTAFLEWVTGGKTDPIKQLQRFTDELDPDKMSKIGQGVKDLADGLNTLSQVDYKALNALAASPGFKAVQSMVKPTSPTTPTPTPSAPAGGQAAPATPSPSPAAPAAPSARPSQVAGGATAEAPGVPIDYKSYADEIAKKESGGNYAAVNTLGYLGKYQFGAMALEDMGLVKKGVGRMGQKALDDPSNWNIEGGKQAFLNNAKLQEETMARYTQQNFKTLNRIGVINKDSSPQEVAGYLAAAHLLGPGGAKALAQGQSGTDAYGTSSATYYKVGMASQGGAGTQVAAATSTPSKGATVASASAAVADGQRAMVAGGGSSTTVIDNSNRTTVASAGSSGRPASTYDRDIFDAIIGQAA